MLNIQPQRSRANWGARVLLVRDGCESRSSDSKQAVRWLPLGLSIYCPQCIAYLFSLLSLQVLVWYKNGLKKVQTEWRLQFWVNHTRPVLTSRQMSHRLDELSVAWPIRFEISSTVGLSGDQPVVFRPKFQTRMESTDPPIDCDSESLSPGHFYGPLLFL